MSKNRKNMATTTNNLVAKHAHDFNKAAVHKCRKKEMKRGYQKHKGRRHIDL